MKAKQTAFVLAVVFVAYAVLIGWRGVLLIEVGTPVPVVLGVAVLVIPLVGAYLVWREIQFGRQTEALARELEAAGGLPVDDLPRRPSGRVDRAAADEAFGRYKAAAEAAPDDWRVWFRLSPDPSSSFRTLPTRAPCSVTLPMPLRMTP